MNEILTKNETETKEIPNNNENASTNQGGKTVNIKFKFDVFSDFINAIFDNEFLFISAFVSEYKGKKIEQYYTEKIRKDGVKYYSARLPAVQKRGILKMLDTLINYELEKVTTKDVLYHVTSVNQAAIDKERAKQAA